MIDLESFLTNEFADGKSSFVAVGKQIRLIAGSDILNGEETRINAILLIQESELNCGCSITRDAVRICFAWNNILLPAEMLIGRLLKYELHSLVVSTHEAETRVPLQNVEPFEDNHTNQPQVLFSAISPPMILDIVAGLDEQPQGALALQL